ncbi:hypothetical protein [Limosilactobacillus sp.]|uniref:hypothetical protein n=1 Tax=Limosilactobacillus sp. TaxID=2773925 RepID=UPI003F0E19AB
MEWQTAEAYFKKMIGKKVAWTISQPEDGLVRAGYPLYDQELLEFVRHFKTSTQYDPHYRKTLRHYHVKPKMTAVTVSQVLLINNVTAAAAMLSLIVDGEDVQRGTWAAAMQAGYFYRLLKILNDNKVAE